MIGRGVFVLLIGLMILKLSGVVDLSFPYLVFLFLNFTLGSLNNCFNLYLKGKDQASVIAVSGILCTFVICVSNYLLLIVFDFNIVGYMISNNLGLLVQALYQIIVGKIYLDLRLKNYNDLSKPMIKYSFPLIANSLAWWVNNASDRYILTIFQGVAVNGVYSVSYKIPSVLTTFQSIFYNAWSISAITEFNKDDEDGFLGNSYSFYSFLSILVCGGLILLNIPLARILYSGDFFEAWKSVPFLLVGTVFNGISQFEGSLFAAVKRTKSVATTTVLGAVLNTVLNIVFIQIWGAVGAAFATMMGYCLTWILRTVFLQSFVHMKVKWVNHVLVIILLMLEAMLATLNALYIVQVLLMVAVLVLQKDFIKRLKNVLFNFIKSGHFNPK